MEMNILTNEERGLCKMFPVRCISRDNVVGAEYEYVDFWSGTPTLVRSADGIGYYDNSGADQIVSVLVDCYSTQIRPGECYFVFDNGEHICKRDDGE